MKSKTLTAVLIVTAVLILFGYTLYKQNRINEQTRANLPYLTAGERIEYFDLLDQDANQIDSSVFSSRRPHFLFIFSRPCSPCDDNIKYWRKMREILKDRVDFYGIILGDATTAFNFSEEVGLNFKLYIPVDLDKFIQAMRIKLSYSQTIIYAQDEVKHLKLGKLEGEEAVKIINMAKDLMQKI